MATKKRSKSRRRRRRNVKSSNLWTAGLTITGLGALGYLGLREWTRRQLGLPKGAEIVDGGKEGDTKWAVFKYKSEGGLGDTFGWAFREKDAEAPAVSDGGYLSAESAKTALFQLLGETGVGGGFGSDPSEFAGRSFQYLG